MAEQAGWIYCRRLGQRALIDQQEREAEVGGALGRPDKGLKISKVSDRAYVQWEIAIGTKPSIEDGSKAPTWKNWQKRLILQNKTGIEVKHQPVFRSSMEFGRLSDFLCCPSEREIKDWEGQGKPIRRDRTARNVLAAVLLPDSFPHRFGVHWRHYQ